MGKNKNRHADVPFEKIVVDYDFNSRTHYDGIEQLAESILQHGLIQDLGGKYHSDGEQVFLTVGFRRYKAIEHIRNNVNPDAFNVVPFVIHDAKTSELRLRNLAENIDREQLSGAEVADYIHKLVNTGMDQRTIAAHLGRPQSWVSYHYKVKARLCPQAWKAFENNELTLENALYVADLEEKEQPAIVKQVKEADTRAEAKKIAKSASKEKGSRRAYKNKGRPSPKNLTMFVDEVSFKSTGKDLDTDTQQFYNGVVAGLRIALGDKDIKKVRPNHNFFDTDFSGTAKAEAEKEERKKAKAEAKAAKKASRKKDGNQTKEA